MKPRSKDRGYLAYPRVRKEPDYGFLYLLINELKNNPTIVVITDRNDLDDQLFTTFQNPRIFKQRPLQAHVRKLTEEQKLQQAKENSKEINGLYDLLNERESGGIIFTTIQKFMPEEGEMPVLTDRKMSLLLPMKPIGVNMSRSRESRY